MSAVWPDHRANSHTGPLTGGTCAPRNTNEHGIDATLRHRGKRRVMSRKKTCHHCRLSKLPLKITDAEAPHRCTPRSSKALIARGWYCSFLRQRRLYGESPVSPREDRSLPSLIHTTHHPRHCSITHPSLQHYASL